MLGLAVRLRALFLLVQILCFVIRGVGKDLTRAAICCAKTKPDVAGGRLKNWNTCAKPHNLARIASISVFHLGTLIRECFGVLCVRIK